MDWFYWDQCWYTTHGTWGGRWRDGRVKWKSSSSRRAALSRDTEECLRRTDPPQREEKCEMETFQERDKVSQRAKGEGQDFQRSPEQTYPVSDVQGGNLSPAETG